MALFLFFKFQPPAPHRPVHPVLITLAPPSPQPLKKAHAGLASSVWKFLTPRKEFQDTELSSRVVITMSTKGSPWKVKALGSSSIQTPDFSSAGYDPSRSISRALFLLCKSSLTSESKQIARCQHGQDQTRAFFNFLLLTALPKESLQFRRHKPDGQQTNTQNYLQKVETQKEFNTQAYVFQIWSWPSKTEESVSANTLAKH